MPRPNARAAIGLLALTALAPAVATNLADAAPAAKHRSGRYAHAKGGGQATLTEDAANHHHHMTLIGRIAG